MATLHLVCGPVGAGKTTRAHEVAARSGGVVFTIDDWMVALFGPDAWGVVHMDWIQPRLVRCEEQIWKLARRLLALGIDPVLDLGFLRREHRDLYRRLGTEAGAQVSLHAVSAPVEIRRERVRARNRDRQGTFSLPVSDELFDSMEGWYQPPEPDELRA